MAITNFIPDVWSARLLTTLRDSHVFASPAVVNRDYEGDISAYGDSVKITTISDPTIRDYTAHTDTTLEDVDDTGQTLVIDQAKYFDFEIDDIESRQARGPAAMTQATANASYGLRDATDSFVADTMAAGVAVGNELSAVAIDTSGEADQALIDLSVALDESNVPSEGRWVVVTPAFHGLLLGSAKFTAAADYGNAQPIQNGMVGRAYGFTVLKSNNCPAADAGAGNKILAGHPIAFSFAEQLASLEAYRPERRFADALKGLHLYGGRVIRPTALAAIDTTTA